MIKFFLHPLYRDSRLISIEDVPEEALAIVKEFEPLFDDRSIYYDGLWAENSDLPQVEYEKLIDLLQKAGYECTILEPATIITAN